MADALIVTVAEVKARMSVPSGLAGADPTITSAITAAQHQIEAAYDTSIPKQALTAVFFIDGDAFSGIAPDGIHRLYLPNGFIRKDTVPVVTSGSKWNSCEDVVPVTDYVFDYARGIIKIDEKYREKYIKFVGETGFNAADETAPSWLKEAILGYVPRVFDWGIKTDSDADSTEAYKASADHGLAVLSPHARNIGLCHKAVYSA